MQQGSVGADTGAGNAEAVEAACMRALVAALLEADDLTDMLDRVADRAVAQLRDIAAIGRARMWADDESLEATETA
jgi:uncharacterized protein YigA (DUF484 family)